MMRSWMTPFAVGISLVACSAAPSSPDDGKSQSSASTGDPTVCGTDEFLLSNDSVTAWQPGMPVTGVVVRLFEDAAGDADWVVVDMRPNAVGGTDYVITGVLAVAATYRDAFYSTVALNSPGGPGCTSIARDDPTVPCNGNGGSSGGGGSAGLCQTYYSPQAVNLDPICIHKELATVDAPACVAHPCQPLACPTIHPCGTMPDGCGNTKSCGGDCTVGHACISNTCVSTTCARGYRWCGDDGCVRGSVCP
jgi:hypothetical protein